MAEWNTPKTNWAAGDIPMVDDFNRIEGNIDFLKQDIETKKGLIVDAINDMNQPAQVTDTYAQLASKIRSISKDATAAVGDVEKGKTFYAGGQKRTGTLELTGNAGTGDVLSGKTFYNTALKTKRTGTMPNRGAVVITPSTSNQTIPAGYHNGQGYVKGDVNLVPENIAKGKSIFGVNGVYGNPIKSIQQGIIENASGELTVQINPVNVNSSVAIIETGGTYYRTYKRVGVHSAKLQTQNTLFIKLSETTQMIGWKVIEFRSEIVKSLQWGESYGYNEIITIEPVNIEKTLVIINSVGTATHSGDAYLRGTIGQLTSSTNLQLYVSNTSAYGSITRSWHIIEFV